MPDATDQAPVATESLRKQDVREALLKSGHTIVARGGFSALSMAAIAAQADMATGNLYRYFEDKASLSVGIFERASQHEMHAVFECVNQRAAPALQLEMLLTAFLQRSLANPQLAYSLIAEPVDPAVERTRSEHRRHWAKRFVEVIEDGIQQKQFEADRPLLAATALIGAVAEPLAVPPGDLTLEKQDIAPLVAFCLRALQRQLASL